MEKRVTLNDGREVVIRDMRLDDTERSHEFFQSLPPEDRRYLRVDVTDWDVVRARIRDIESGRVLRLAVLDGDRIVADGALELAGHGWGDNVAEIRLIVARDYQRIDLGSRLARELYSLAATHRVERIVARFMRPQEGARRILQRLGFHDEFVIPQQIHDRDGRWQDMVIMRCNLEELWQQMEGLLGMEDWQSRYSAGHE